MTKNRELEQIIAGCQRGESESFSRLVDIYSGRFYGYFYRLTGNRTISDDLLSELFVKLVEKIGSFKGGSFDGWVFRIASNIFHDFLRAKQRGKKLLEGRKELELENAQSGKADDERGEKLQVHLGKLDGDTRELIMLRYYSQLSFKEIAKLRAKPIGTVLAKVHRGLKKLRKSME
ncbi:MAG: RNA polymerase sigma factor [Planctomycetes bacterium]|nr:RNA polymerase sigma factor [Planctomycetota bacterium]